MDEGFLQPFIIRDMRKHAQLDLGVVRRQNAPARLGRNEDLAQLAALLQTDRNVLQIRILAAKTACRGNRLTIVRVHFARL